MRKCDVCGREMMEDREYRGRWRDFEGEGDSECILYSCFCGRIIQRHKDYEEILEPGGSEGL